MSTISNNVVSNGLVGSTVSVGYGAVPPATPLTVGTVYPAAGQFLTSGLNGTSWATTTDNVMIVKQNPASLEVKGRMILNGVDLEERLNTIEKVLQIPERDAILEKKHPKLKKLYDEYTAALGKYRTFEAIKGEDDVT